MSVLRRLYNVAYGKVRSWQSEDVAGGGEDLDGSLPRYRTDAADAIAALKERLGQLEAEADGVRGRTERAEPLSERPQRDLVDDEPRPSATPRQRQL